MFNSKSDLPGLPRSRVEGLSSIILPSALAQYDDGIMGAASDNADAYNIDVLGQIGYDPWTGTGVTSRSVASALKQADGADVQVNINSPGGDAFEGIAIYNMLREYKGNVTVKVLGLAASAASIVAMAGDTVQIARAGFLMIHNTWVLAAGNRNDLRDFADTLEPIDRAMADVYSARSGLSHTDVATMMDKESWINGSDAVSQGFADSLLPSDKVKKDGKKAAQAHAVRKLDAALARAGMTRSERRDLLRELKAGMHDAPGGDTQDAAPNLEPLEFNFPNLESSHE